MKKYKLVFLIFLLICPFFSIAQKVDMKEVPKIAKIVFEKYNQSNYSISKFFG